jgi:hypothetical protein
MNKSTTTKKAAAPKKSAAPKKLTAKPTRSAPKVSSEKGKSVSTYTDTLPEWQREIAHAIGALVAKEAPRSTASIKWAQPVWEHGGPLAWFRASKNHVSFGFWRGAELEDPDGVLEGDGDRMRHVKIKMGDSLPRRLGAMVRAAVALNEQHGDPTKKK